MAATGVTRLVLPVLAVLACTAATHTVASRVAQYGEAARTRLAPAFRKAGVTYPPRAVTLVGLKEERILQVYAGALRDGLVHVIEYPVLAASGGVGPKLREGDAQVPEGLYRIVSLNPNSAFHLSLRVSYPNAFDRRQAAADGRARLGGDIMIHGNAVSIGCLAMGDAVAEELFVLAADTGLANVAVVLAPHDLRRRPAPKDAALPSWAPTLHAEIAAALAGLPGGR